MKLTEKENEILFQLKKEITENVMMNSDAVLFYHLPRKTTSLQGVDIRG